MTSDLYRLHSSGHNHRAFSQYHRRYHAVSHLWRKKEIFSPVTFSKAFLLHNSTCSFVKQRIVCVSGSEQLSLPVLLIQNKSSLVHFSIRNLSRISKIFESFSYLWFPFRMEMTPLPYFSKISCQHRHENTKHLLSEL